MKKTALFDTSVLSKILTVVTILSILAGIYATFWGFGKNNEASRLRATLHERTVAYEDSLGRKIKEVTQLEISLRELKRVSKKDSAQLNAYERKVLQLYQELGVNERKLKQVESALLFTSRTRDSFAIKLEALEQNDSIELLPLKQGIFVGKWSVQEFTYNPNNDSLFVDQIQETEFFVDMYKQRQLKENGKPHCFLWRWTLPWEYQASVKSLRDSTVITEAAYVNVRK